VIQLITAQSAQVPVAEGESVRPPRDLPASISGARSEGDFIAQLAQSLLQSADGVLEGALQPLPAAAEQPLDRADELERAEEVQSGDRVADTGSVETDVVEDSTAASTRDTGSANAALEVEALPAERWLKGMQHQQQAVVTARDGRALPAQPAVAAQPHILEGAQSTGTDETILQNASLLAAGHAREGGPSPAAAAAFAASLESTSNVDTAAAAQRGQAPASATLQLQTPEAKWGEQMLQALRNHVQLQIQQQSQHATIRLDPPELGSLDLQLSHESGRLTVQITAVNADIARLLQQTSERLRQELVGQNFLQVEVQVFSDGQQDRHQHARQHQPRLTDEPPLAANASTAAERQHAERDSNLLVTV